jgi:hypothetical protein
MSAVWTAIFTMLIVQIVAPTMLYLQRRAEKREDWRRMDTVAEKVEEARKALEASDELAGVRAQKIDGKLNVIHTLVNSQMTAAMQAELDATTRELAMMREVIDLKERAGHPASEAATAALQTTERKVNELRTALSDREQGV